MTALSTVQLRGIVRRLEREAIGGEPDWERVRAETENLIDLVVKADRLAKREAPGTHWGLSVNGAG